MEGGRPSKFSQETADAICEQIVQGKSVRQICQQQGMPAERTVYYWLEKDREFCQQYARARGPSRPLLQPMSSRSLTIALAITSRRIPKTARRSSALTTSTSNARGCA